jgi:hypothetical protein
MQPVENFHRFDKLKHCMVLPEAFYLTGNIEKYGSAFICIRKTIINRNLKFYEGKSNIKPQSSAGAGARWINRRLTRRVRGWLPARRAIKLGEERPNQITRISTDLEEMSTGVFATRMGQGKNKYSVSRLTRFLLFLCQSLAKGLSARLTLS